MCSPAQPIYVLLNAVVKTEHHVNPTAHSQVGYGPPGPPSKTQRGKDGVDPDPQDPGRGGGRDRRPVPLGKNRTDLMPASRQVLSQLGGHSLVSTASTPPSNDQCDAKDTAVRTFARRVIIPATLTVGLTACKVARPPAEPPPTPARHPASGPSSGPSDLAVVLSETSSIAAENLRTHVFALASDTMEGRGPATAGLERAAQYLERSLRGLGISPAFGPSYRQPFEMTVSVRIRETSALAKGLHRFRFMKDFAPFAFSTNGQATGLVAFLGFGIRSEAHDYDDYAGIDVAGKVVVVLEGEPGDDDPKSAFDGRRRTRHADPHTKLLIAREAKAAGLIIVRQKLTTPPRGAVKDAGLVALQMHPEAAGQLTGLDLAAVKARIDASSQPESKLLGGSPVMMEAVIERERRTVHNIGGFLDAPGTTEAVVIGAHYDHLGMGGPDSLAPDKEPQIHNGADDNASGTAVVLEVARTLSNLRTTLQRDVLLLLFAGEEDGLLGSSHFVRNPTIPTESMVAMVNLDMVGRLRANRLNVMGVKTATEFEGLVPRLVTGQDLSGTYGGDGYGPSDHTAFYAAGVPVLFLFTGAHSDYHKPSDDPDKLNYLGMAKVAGVAADLVRAFASAPARPTYVKAPPPKVIGGGRGYGAYFGSIPDFGQDVKGVLFAGIREGSPAARAGVKKGDVLVEFGGVTVLNLRDFTYALRGSAPGDTVRFKVKRGQKVMELETTLERRE